MRIFDHRYGAMGVGPETNVLSSWVFANLRRNLVALAFGVSLFAGAGDVQAGGQAPSTDRETGAIDGLWYWRLPDTPNGLHPNQSWSGASVAPNGDIYIAGMDHYTNAALYRLRYGRLRYVGDARTASEG